MKIRCIAIDQDPTALAQIRRFISGLSSFKLVRVFDNAPEGLEYLGKNRVDLLFIDINISAVTGSELAELIRDHTMIIFTVDYQKFAPENLELDALDYLVKPIRFDRFAKAVNKATEYYQHKKFPEKTIGEVLFIRSEYRLIKIDLNEIEYIESVENYLRINLSHEKPLMTLMTLKSMLEKLPRDRFIRIHRSYIIPVDKIKMVSNRKIKLRLTELPVSDSYIGQLKELVKK